MKLSWAIKPSGLALSILLLLLLSACNSSSKYDYAAGRNLPNAKYGTIYTVKRGDTLYSIAWVIKQDYRKLAGWNGIRFVSGNAYACIRHHRKRQSRKR